MTAWVESFEGHTIDATEIIDAGDKVLVAILQRRQEPPALRRPGTGTKGLI